MMMNDVLKTIKQRRSIRQYDDRQIGEEALDTIMEAAIFAPSAANQQKWHFTVIQNKALLTKMVQITRKNKIDSNISFLVKLAKREDYQTYYGAPTVIIVSGEKNTRFVEMDCAAAAQNIVLAAQSIGISSCIITSGRFLFESDEGEAMKKKLGIPETYEHACSISLGYSDGDEQSAPPRNRGVFSFIKNETEMITNSITSQRNFLFGKAEGK
jgi:nitroreductase